MGNKKGVSKSIPNGSVWPQQCGSDLEIINFVGNSTFEVKFKDSPIFKAENREIKNGLVFNKNTPSCCGVGYIGYGRYSTTEGSGKNTTTYQIWSGLFKRCYNPTRDDYYRYGGKGVTVCDEWHNFQNFAEWYESSLKEFPNHYKTKFEIDKDLKSGLIYSPDNCVLIPYKLNNFITNNSFESGMGYVKNGKSKITTTISMLGKQVFIGDFTKQSDADKYYNIAKNYVKRKMADSYYNLKLISSNTKLLIYNQNQNYSEEDEYELFKLKPTLKTRVDKLFENEINLFDKCKGKKVKDLYK